MEKQYPLILVFYLDIELMKDKSIMVPFTEAVNEAIAKRQANAMAFFLPTTGEERIECINPIMLKEADMENVNKIVEEIKTAFSVGVDIDVKGADIIIEEKSCDCNPNCNCND